MHRGLAAPCFADDPHEHSGAARGSSTVASTKRSRESAFCRDRFSGHGYRYGSAAPSPTASR